MVQVKGGGSEPGESTARSKAGKDPMPEQAGFHVLRPGSLLDK